MATCIEMTGEDLREARERSGLGHRPFAAALGIGKSSLDRWERGERPVPRTVALAVTGLAAVAAAIAGERV